MRTLICLFSLITTLTAHAGFSPRPVTIAIIDTGLTLRETHKDQFLCKYGHKDFSGINKFETFLGTVDPVPSDRHGHGTNIAGLIREYANMTDQPFCLVIIKYYDPSNRNRDTLSAEIAAIKYATNINADIINFSGGGQQFSADEAKAVRVFIDRGGVFVAAAGNEGADLSKTPYYPAQADNRVISVGNLKSDGTVNKSSNYGSPVTRWENGTNRIGFNTMMTGTSQACAIATGKIVGEKFFRRDIRKKIVAIRK